jgi:hypothetical protein
LSLFGLARIFFTALGAFTVDDDSCASAVRTENPVFQTVGVIVIHRLLGLEIQRRAAFHTEMARGRNDCLAFGTGLTRYLFVAMGAFHNRYQLFEEVTV